MMNNNGSWSEPGASPARSCSTGFAWWLVASWGRPQASTWAAGWLEQLGAKGLVLWGWIQETCEQKCWVYDGWCNKEIWIWGFRTWFFQHPKGGFDQKYEMDTQKKQREWPLNLGFSLRLKTECSDWGFELSVSIYPHVCSPSIWYKSIWESLTSEWGLAGEV